MLYQCVRLLGPETVVVVAGVVVDAGMVVFVVDDVGHGEVVGIIGCVVVVGVEDGVEDGVVEVVVVVSVPKQTAVSSPRDANDHLKYSGPLIKSVTTHLFSVITAALLLTPSTPVGVPVPG